MSVFFRARTDVTRPASGRSGGVRVRADAVSRCYGHSEVLHEVSFTVEPGALVALSGPSGSGKTTLLQLIGSLDRPSRGRILVGEIDVGALRQPALFRRSTVGFVFQLHHLLPTLSARENVELPMVAARVPRRERHARAVELLEEVGLPGREDALPSDLSGGERQRVAIARALINQPPLILADEPTGALDSKATGRIWHLLSEIRERRGTTVIIASHDPALGELVDSTLELLDGRLVDVRTRSGSGVAESPGVEDAA